MHIPDGFLSIPVAASTYVISGSWVGYSIKRVREEAGEKAIPTMGVLAAFIFAAQMINFPVAGGTSGHLVGGTLIAILFGPYVASIIMSTILIAQSLLFADGGITALGANILNMGIIAPIVGFVIYRALRKWHFKASIFIASWVSIVLSAAACALELSLSGTIPINVSLPAMVSVHALIGIGEGLITLFVILAIEKFNPDLIVNARLHTNNAR